MAELTCPLRAEVIPENHCHERIMGAGSIADLAVCRTTCAYGLSLMDTVHFGRRKPGAVVDKPFRVPLDLDALVGALRMYPARSRRCFAPALLLRYNARARSGHRYRSTREFLTSLALAGLTVDTSAKLARDRYLALDVRARALVAEAKAA